METSGIIFRWLKPLAVRGDLTKVVLWNKNVHDKLDQIACLEFGEDKGEYPEDDEGIKTVANELDSSSYLDASGLGGMQTYMVTAHVGDKQVSRLPFRVSAGGDDEGDGFGSEPATQKGALAQSMRLTDSSFKIALGATGSVIQQLQRQNKTLHEQIEKLESQRLQTWQALQDAEDRKAEREIAIETAKGQAEIRAKSWSKLMLIAPLVVNKLAGRKILPEEYGKAGGHLKALAESISEDQFTKIREILGPEQLAALGNFMLEADEENEDVPTTALTKSNGTA